jgi:threonylcarbamoyladenosine tRNA methylthiotransferase MtaB
MVKTSKVAIQTLGCKLNQAESESLVRWLTEEGCKVVSPDQQPDVYIINSCTVTRTADQKCRQMLHRARRQNPQANVVATGCYVRRSAAEAGGTGPADMLLKDSDPSPLLDVIRPSGQRAISRADHPFQRTRSLVKVQEGCNTPCTYCIVPAVRGREVSKKVEDIIHEVQDRVSEGYKEVVLTGTKVGAYGWNGTGLEALLKRVLATTEVRRLRLSSLQPREISPGLLALWTDERLCRHFHIALQSGSKAVLRRMGRSYSPQQFATVVSKVKESIPDAAITTDVMVGFPGETEEEHMESLAFCREMAFAAMHVFPYSPRPGTPASSMADQVDDKTKKRRAAEMLSLAAQSKRRFQEQFLGRTFDVLWESPVEGHPSTWSGLTSNYIGVLAHSTDRLAG